jgi:hypothetical protein
MKLSDFVFRNKHFFIDMFVDPSNTKSLKAVVDDLNVYKWGIAEPGASGRIILSCSSNGEIQKSATLAVLPEQLTVFFAFLPEGDYCRSDFDGLDYIIDVWSEGSTFFRCGGLEVVVYQQDSLVELIKAANEG